MFITWKEKLYGNTKMLQAEIRSSFRDRTSGKPVSQYIAYLGSIREDQADNIYFNRKFWVNASGKIELLDVSEEVKLRLLRQLHERIPLVERPAPAPPTFIGELIRKGRRNYPQN